MERGSVIDHVIYITGNLMSIDILLMEEIRLTS